MNPATVGLAAALGLQLSNLLWDATFIVICLIGACLLCALVFEGLVIWDMLRKPKPAPEVDDSVRMLSRWLEDDAIAGLEKQLKEGDGR